jgi:lipid-A-disaccharide synthase
MKYYIIAGEASGDLHASNMMRAILKKDPEASFRFWGGDLMQAVGGTLVKHYRDLAFMGFLEVLKKYSYNF